MGVVVTGNQIQRAVVGSGFGEDGIGFLTAAWILKDAFLWVRRIYLLSDSKRVVSFAFGSALNLGLGNSPTLLQISRIILGSLSIIRCGEDIQKLGKLTRRIKKILSGRHYIPLKGNCFVEGRLFDQFRFEWILRQERIILLFRTIGEIFKQFGSLLWHFGDAYVAYNEDCSSEVFIHGVDLWEHLTSDQSFLVKQLNKCKDINDSIFGPMGWTTKLMLNVITLPAQVVSTAPDIVNVTNKVLSRRMENIRANILVIAKAVFNYRPPDILAYVKGDADDPERTRLMTPPKKVSFCLPLSYN